MNEYLWIWQGIIAICITILWYYWRKNDKKLETVETEAVRLDKEIRNEVYLLKNNYTDEFKKMREQINETELKIIERINELEVGIQKNFMTKADCREINRSRKNNY